MSLRIEFDGLWDCGTVRRIEKALHSCIGEPPGDEEWTVSVTSRGSYCIVLVKTLQQTRRKLFMLRAFELAEVMATWLEQYPLR